MKKALKLFKWIAKGLLCLIAAPFFIVGAICFGIVYSIAMLITYIEF